MDPKSLAIIPFEEFERVRAGVRDEKRRVGLLADMCRLNTLVTVKRAGSGHLGSSFSSLDIVSWLYFHEMNTVRVGFASADRDIYFSSKGHDAPGLYSVLFALGVLPQEKFVKLRRLGGTFGHPDVRVPGVEANTGSLGMGISKGKGLALGKRMNGSGGRVFVMTGDGEFQEGQIYEALLAAANQTVSNLTVIIDHNKLQSDKRVDDISPLGDLEGKVRAFGWHVARCDGHDLGALEAAIEECRRITDRPQLIVADTIKGRGVSFMEHTAALEAGKGTYRWHAGAPPDDAFSAAAVELLERIQATASQHALDPVRLDALEPEDAAPSSVTAEYVAKEYGRALLELSLARPDVVVLDGDLAIDCHIREFELKHPERFIENGIAEQDMVSAAGALARTGFVPIVNTFASFLAARANEQIYNNGCEGSRVVYAAHYGGLLPAGPGATHQSIRDISLFGALPNVEVVEPCNGAESRALLNYAVTDATDSVVLRMIIGPSPRQITLPAAYRPTRGRGVTLAEGEHAILFAYGPVMLHEALGAREQLATGGFSLRVVNMPWLNRIDRDWLVGMVPGFDHVFVVDDHSPVGGLGDLLLNSLNELGLLRQLRLHKLAVDGYPACGTPAQVLAFHGLDAASLARRIAAVAAESIALETVAAVATTDGWAG